MQQLAAFGNHALVHLPALQVEGLVEPIRVCKELGVEEVEERPELVQVVLERRTGQEQLALALDQPQALVQRRLLILDPMPLIEHEIAPVDAMAEHGLHVRRVRHLIGSDHHVEVGDVGQEFGAHQLALILVARVEAHDAHLGREPLELVDPRGEHREWCDHQRRPLEVAFKLEEA